MKTILCLIDDTSSGKTALEIAHQFFDRAPYKIVIARIEPADRIENREYFLARLHELSQEIFLSGIERQGDIRIEIAFGNFPDQCRVLVDKHHASLLIIGRRKKKIHEGVFFGETTHKMIQRLDIPVIISPEEGKAPALTTIYYATDFSPGSISTLDVLLPWCSGLRLHLHLLHVSETEEEEFKATAKMNKILHSFAEDKEEVGMEFQILIGAPFTAMADFLKEQPGVMLAITLHDRAFWERITEHSLVWELTAAIKNPIWIFKQG